MYIRMCLSLGLCTWVQIPPRSKRICYTMELELQVVVSPPSSDSTPLPLWMLRTECESYTRTVCAPNLWDISVAPTSQVLRLADMCGMEQLHCVPTRLSCRSNLFTSICYLQFCQRGSWEFTCFLSPSTLPAQITVQKAPKLTSLPTSHKSVFLPD